MYVVILFKYIYNILEVFLICYGCDCSGYFMFFKEWDVGILCY